ncbi:hypothetical protein [Tepidimicrobium xylanilyticum]|uniref:hypothetical protein n=1 Tax=Tepidimicrobium xylanilyticum TaxID=1123352 RepID=UPI0026550C91|nr:hypothetical protein [Tepidimicrobium xylanilyticum]GMG96175.1 hypothetical protein EN5CB1_10010 [Tepidimicrobium xylanilyticum]
MENPILKSVIRRPIKFALLILILSSVSSTFIMNFISYNLISKEVESAKKPIIALATYKWICQMVVTETYIR